MYNWAIYSILNAFGFFVFHFWFYIGHDILLRNIHNNNEERKWKRVSHRLGVAGRAIWFGPTKQLIESDLTIINGQIDKVIQGNCIIVAEFSEISSAVYMTRRETTERLAIVSDKHTKHRVIYYEMCFGPQNTEKFTHWLNVECLSMVLLRIVPYRTALTHTICICLTCYLTYDLQNVWLESMSLTLASVCFELQGPGWNQWKCWLNFSLSILHPH